MNIEISTLLVCGAKEIKGMNSRYWTAEGFLKAIVLTFPTYAKPYKGDPRVAGYGYYSICAAGHVSEVEGEFYYSMKELDRMNEFKKYIEDNSLGNVLIGPDCFNPNYVETHTLRPAIFTPDNAAIIKYAVKQKWIKAPKKACDKAAHVSYAWGPMRAELG